MLSPDVISRFHSLYSVTESGCWEWYGTKDRDGYGKMRCGGRRVARAHRLSYVIATGIDPGELLVCHKCDNPSCVNPDHLYAGTAKQNTKDKIDRGRANYPIAEKVATTVLTRDQVKEVFSMYATGNLKQSDIADHFGVSQATIQLILCGKNWKHLGMGMVVGMRKAKKPALRVMTDEDEAAMAKEYAQGGISQHTLAKKYGVSQSLVSMITISRKGKSND